jgi:large subunit ribosomal protein L28
MNNNSPLNHNSATIRLRSTRSTRGLYDGKDVRFGNNVPFSQKKTRRRWNPNMQYKAVYSEVLDEMVKFHLTTSALRTIDKYGGLDEYLLRSKHVSTKG